MTYNIYILDTIGYPISSAYVRQELAKCKDKPCDVYISSLGGDVATALQIRQLFIEHGDVTAHLHGFVASAATIVATGAKQVKMGEFALFMIHKCSAWQEQWGQMNADDIAAAIDKLTSAKNALDSIDQVIGSIYAQRTGKDITALVEMMKAETWLSAEEAMEQGFVNEIIPDEQPASLTDDMRQRIVAYGYPVPELQGKQQPNSWQRFAALIENLFKQQSKRIADDALENLEPSNSIHNLKTHSTIMNKDYKSILALLAVEAIAVSEDGSATLSAFQLQQIEAALAVNADKLASADKDNKDLQKQVKDLTNHVSDLSSEKSRLEDKVNELTSQVEALQKADGEETTHIEGNGENNTAMTYAARARADYEKIKSLIA